MKDLIIIGAGPAGLSAAVYAKRAGLDAVMIDESSVFGGQILSTYEVDNYLGFSGISGIELGEKFSEHVKKADIETMATYVKDVVKNDSGYVVVTGNGDIESKTVILATGAKHALLNVPGEEELSGMGVSYCATCDGAFFKRRDVAVVGGSDVAVEDAIYLARTCKKVYLIHRRDTLRAANSLVEALKACENVEFVWDSEVKEIKGEDQVENVVVHNKKTDEDREISLQGVFIAVGIRPSSDIAKSLGVNMSEDGYVLASEDTRTNLPGFYVAGDIRKKPMRQIITAVADGANAASSAASDISEKLV